MASVAEDVRRPKLGREPPNNKEAEESVLGSMMLSSEAVAEVMSSEPESVVGV